MPFSEPAVVFGFRLSLKPASSIASAQAAKGFGEAAVNPEAEALNPTSLGLDPKP